jgi:hypothetical protein
MSGQIGHPVRFFVFTIKANIILLTRLFGLVIEI